MIRFNRSVGITLSDTLIFLYCFSFAVRFISNLGLLISSLFFMGIGLFVLFYDCVVYYESSKQIAVFCFMDFVCLLNAIINGNGTHYEAILLCVYQALGILLFFDKNKLLLFWKLLAVIMMIIIVRIFTLERVLVSDLQYSIIISRLVGGNSVSIIAIFTCSIYLLYCRYYGHRIVYFPFVVSLIIAIYIGGNGGILCTALFLIGICFFDRSLKHVLKIRVLFAIVLSFFLLLCFGLGSRVLSFVSDDNSRLWIWIHYLDCATTSFKDFVFGGNIRDVPFLVEMKNMHNTFINFHFRYGLIPFVFYVFALIRCGIVYFKRKDYLMLLILSITIIRSMTDEACFGFLPLWVFMFLDTNERTIKKKKLTLTKMNEEN